MYLACGGDLHVCGHGTHRAKEWTSEMVLALHGVAERRFAVDVRREHKACILLMWLDRAFSVPICGCGPNGACQKIVFIYRLIAVARSKTLRPSLDVTCTRVGLVRNSTEWI